MRARWTKANSLFALGNHAVSIASQRWLMSGLRCALGLSLFMPVPLHATSPRIFMIQQASEGAEDTLRWIDQLEQRRLFRLAAEALDQATSQQDDEALRYKAQVRRIRVEAAWAVETLGDERQLHWDRAHQLAEGWIAETNSHRQEALLKVQDALTWLAEAEMLRDEDAGRAVRSAEISSKAMNALRSARLILEPVLASIPEWMNERDPRATDAWDSTRWINLQRNVGFHLARVALERGHWSSANEPVDRMEAFQTAAQQFKEVARQISFEDPLAWQVVLARARSAREINDLQETFDVLVPPETRASDELWLAWIDQAPPALKGKLVAERVRLEQAAGASEAAGRWAVRALEGAFGNSAELDLAILERLLERWKTTSDEAFQNQAVAWAKQVEIRHGAYWGRRAQRILVAGATTGPVANLDLIMQVADERMLQGEVDEARKEYREALTLAQQNERRDIEKLATIRLAALAQATASHAEAITLFEQATGLAQEPSEQSRMAWLAVWNRIQYLQTLREPEQAEEMLLQQESLIQAAQNFLQQWPESLEAGEARVALSSRLVMQQNWIGALEVALESPIDDPAASRLATIIDLATLQLATQLARGPAENDVGSNEPLPTQNANQDSRPIVSAIDRNALQELVARWKSEAQSWSEPSDAVAAFRRWQKFVQGVRLSDLVEEPIDWEFEVWQAKLDRWTQLAGSDSILGEQVQAWQAETRLTALVQQVRQGQAIDATAIADRGFERIATRPLLAAVTQLAAQRQRQADQAQRRSIAELEWQLISQTLTDARLTEAADRVRRDMLASEALLAAGKDAEGVQQIEALIKNRPNDGRVQRWAAQQLTAASSEYRDQAIEQWRRVTARSAPRTDGWFEGRYWIARLTAESGDRDRARQLLLFLKETPPGWEDAPNREALEALFQQVSQ